MCRKVRRIIRLRGVMDSAESTSAVSLTPRRQTQWTLALTLCLVKNVYVISKEFSPTLTGRFTKFFTLDKGIVKNKKSTYGKL